MNVCVRVSAGRRGKTRNVISWHGCLPAASTISGPGWSSKWYVLQNINWSPLSSVFWLSIAFNVPFVPTATKDGVSMTPWGVCILPTRANEPGFFDACTISNRKKSRSSYVHFGKDSGGGGGVYGSILILSFLFHFGTGTWGASEMFEELQNDARSRGSPFFRAEKVALAQPPYCKLGAVIVLGLASRNSPY